jgi:hypothetical protein
MKNSLQLDMWQDHARDLHFMKCRMVHSNGKKYGFMFNLPETIDSEPLLVLQRMTADPNGRNNLMDKVDDLFYSKMEEHIKADIFVPEAAVFPEPLEPQKFLNELLELIS